MKFSKGIFILFLFFPLFLFIQFAYGLIVREPYPSFMMPGFSRIDNSDGIYTLVDKRLLLTHDQHTDTVAVNELTENFSKIALSRAMDNAFFDPSTTHNSKQKGYYEVIENMLGEDIYKSHVLDVRNPPLTESNLASFENWISERCIELTDYTLSEVVIERISTKRNFITGKIVENTVLDSYKIEI